MTITVVFFVAALKYGSIKYSYLSGWSATRRSNGIFALRSHCQTNALQWRGG